MLCCQVYVAPCTNLSEARYCAGMGVQYIGIVIDEAQPNYLSPENFLEIKGWLVGVSFIGITEENDSTRVKQKMGVYQLDGVETTSIGVAMMAANEEYLVFWKGETEMQEITFKIKNTFETNCTTPTFFSITEMTEQLHSEIERNPNCGLLVKSSPEERPGVVNMDILMDILEAIEE